MQANHQELFSSRWALILAALGMAVGTGNIWRFPRIVAQSGGGAFLVAWLIVFLTIVWGGFILSIRTAIKRDVTKEKNQ